MDVNVGSSNSSLKTVAIIPAAGTGVRMENERPKQFLNVDGRPLLAVTLEKFQVCAAVDSIILVAPQGDVKYCRSQIVDRHHLTKVEKVVAGGERRQDSVRLGIEASGGDYGLVLIHDGVRPLVTPDLIVRVIQAAQEHRAVITGLCAKETVKEIDENALVVRTYDRQKVWLVQTPQVFRYEDILMAHRRAVERGWAEVTDDALLIEKAGIPVKVLEGTEGNIKVTTPQDLELVKFLLKRQKEK
ncbi:MAG: 2-C-methyl-D-erythritol 4-phosphate cytidylyltransferase [Deltaproteobacteria bacterium]|nr:MAG: 2-C-methyl-D-erythritol 4-phosphate cytidylyltransferase [Deltaproteobacteria bacterium]